MQRYYLHYLILTCFVFVSYSGSAQNRFMKIMDDFYKNSVIDFKEQNGKIGLALKKGSFLPKMNDIIKAQWYKDTTLPLGTKWVLPPQYDSFNRLENFMVGHRDGANDLISYSGELLASDILGVTPLKIDNSSKIYIVKGETKVGWLFAGLESSESIRYASPIEFDLLQKIGAGPYLMGTQNAKMAMFTLGGKQLTAFARACDASIVHTTLILQGCDGKQGAANMVFDIYSTKTVLPTIFERVYFKDEMVVAETKDSTFYYLPSLRLFKQEGVVASVEEIRKRKNRVAELAVFKTPGGFGLRSGIDKVIIRPVMDSILINSLKNNSYSITCFSNAAIYTLDNIFHGNPDTLQNDLWYCMKCWGYGTLTENTNIKAESGKNYKASWDTHNTDGSIVRTTETGTTADVYRPGTITSTCHECNGLGTARKLVVWDAKTQNYIRVSTKVKRSEAFRY